MEIKEYRAQFIDQLRFDADHEGTEPETQFILKLWKNWKQLEN